MKKKVKSFPFLNFVIYALVIGALGYIGYSVWYYQTNYEGIEEFEVCAGGRCIKTFHVHYTLLVNICGKSMHLPLEHGELAKMHTHKEANYLHFHERIEYDQKTGRLFDESPFILGTTMNVFGIRFNGNCLGEYCIGDSCPDGKKGTVTMLVNNQPSNAFENYRWRDEDVVELRFG